MKRGEYEVAFTLTMVTSVGKTLMEATYPKVINPWLVSQVVISPAKIGHRQTFLKEICQVDSYYPMEICPELTSRLALFLMANCSVNHHLYHR